MKHIVGERVGAFRSMNSKEVNLFGYGVYEGNFPHPKSPFPNPRIKLDNGLYVWGLECWWDNEEPMKARIAGLIVNIVPEEEYTYPRPTDTPAELPRKTFVAHVDITSLRKTEPSVELMQSWIESSIPDAGNSIVEVLQVSLDPTSTSGNYIFNANLKLVLIGDHVHVPEEGLPSFAHYWLQQNLKSSRETLVTVQEVRLFGGVE